MVASEDDWAARELFVSCYLYDIVHEQPTRYFEKHTCFCFWNNTFASQARWGFAAVRDVRLAAHFPPALSAARSAWSWDSWRSDECNHCGHHMDRSDLILGLASPKEVLPTLVTISSQVWRLNVMITLWWFHHKFITIYHYLITSVRVSAIYSIPVLVGVLAWKLRDGINAPPKRRGTDSLKLQQNKQSLTIQVIERKLANKFNQRERYLRILSRGQANIW